MSSEAAKQDCYESDDGELCLCLCDPSTRICRKKYFRILNDASKHITEKAGLIEQNMQMRMALINMKKRVLKTMDHTVHGEGWIHNRFEELFYKIRDAIEGN